LQIFRIEAASRSDCSFAFFFVYQFPVSVFEAASCA
jgi:hypothetical protein